MKMSLLGVEPESMVREPESSYKGVRVEARRYSLGARGYDRSYRVEPEALV